MQVATGAKLTFFAAAAEYCPGIQPPFENASHDAPCKVEAGRVCLGHAKEAGS